MNDSLMQSDQRADQRAARRAARRAASRTEILDAAEKVFGEDGILAGSLRKIAAQSGFSTGAIYKLFEDKQQLLSETLERRADELIAAVREVAGCDLTPLARLHRIVDVAIEFFQAHPDFSQLLRHIRGGATIAGPVLADFQVESSSRFDEVTTVLAGLIRAGQDAGEIREGDARALAHLYEVLINEFVFLTSSATSLVGTLTPRQFHALVDGALRDSSVESSAP